MPVVEMVYGIGIPALITGLLQIAVGAGLPKKISPVLSVVIGLVLAFILQGELKVTFAQSVLVGLYWGLVSVGLYSGTKNVLEYYKNGNGVTK